MKLRLMLVFGLEDRRALQRERAYGMTNAVQIPAVTQRFLPLTKSERQQVAADDLGLRRDMTKLLLALPQIAG